MTHTGISSIAQIIQLSIAPVFLLAGLGGILNVVATRLARVVDRVRMLEGHIPDADAELRAIELKELGILDRRMRLCHWSIGLCTISALLICVVIIVLFVSDLASLDIALTVALLFIAAMGSVTLGLLLFLLEVTIATRFVRVDERFVMRRRFRRDR